MPFLYFHDTADSPCQRCIGPSFLNFLAIFCQALLSCGQDRLTTAGGFTLFPEIVWFHGTSILIPVFILLILLAMRDHEKYPPSQPEISGYSWQNASTHLSGKPSVDSMPCLSSHNIQHIQRILYLVNQAGRHKDLFLDGVFFLPISHRTDKITRWICPWREP